MTQQAFDAFDSNYDGHYINIQIMEGATPVGPINFNAQIADPVLTSQTSIH